MRASRARLAAAVGLLLLGGGCATLGSLFSGLCGDDRRDPGPDGGPDAGPVDQPLTNWSAAEALSRAIGALAASPGGWDATLASLRDELALHGASALAGEVQSLRSSGAESGCSSSDAAPRLRRALERLRAQQLGQAAPPLLGPVVCQVRPVSIDMANRPDAVDFFGLELDGAVTASLVHAGGRVALEPFVSRPSTTHLVLDVSASRNAELCNRNDRRLELFRAGAVLSTVAVVARVCPAAPAPPPRRAVPGSPFERQSASTSDVDVAVGSDCSAGYRRAEASVLSLSSGSCVNQGWVGANSSNCRVTLRMRATASEAAQCQVRLEEEGVPQPAPACPCW